jgi:hypothetical protein
MDEIFRGAASSAQLRVGEGWGGASIMTTSLSLFQFGV